MFSPKQCLAQEAPQSPPVTLNMNLATRSHIVRGSGCSGVNY